MKFDKNDKTPRILVYGGSFDPPHYGHIMSSMHVLNKLKANNYDVKLYVIVSKGFKKDMLPFYHRFNMAKLSWPGDFTLVTDVEDQLTGYTVDTLNYLYSLLPKYRIVFLCGSDVDVNKFKDGEKIIDNYEIINMRRSYSPFRMIDEEVSFMNVPSLKISSSTIKKRFYQLKELIKKEGIDLNNLLFEREIIGIEMKHLHAMCGMIHPLALQYIIDNKLYGF